MSEKARAGEEIGESPVSSGDSPVNAGKADAQARVEGLVEICQTEQAGRGLRARCDLERGQVIFVAPTIRVPLLQYDEHCKFSVFEDYLFHGKSGDYHLCLHLGSIFNHSANPNVNWKLDEETDSITFTVWRPIKKGGDMYISYGAWGQQYEPESESDEEDATKSLFW